MSGEGFFPFRAASGFRPLRGLHIGHYGAVLRDLCRLQYAREESCFVFIADHHSRSQWDEPVDFANGQKRSVELARQLLAVGIDPNYAVLYRQSDVPEIFEFMWFISGLTSQARLDRGRAFIAAGKPTAGIYLYPLLMIADILSLRSTQVVVGKDQAIHVEFAREVARNLLKRFGQEFLPVPECHRSDPAIYRGINGAKGEQKMDSEVRNDVPLFGDEEIIEEQIRRIVTQSVSRSDPLPVKDSLILSYAEAIGGDAAHLEFVGDFQSAKFDYSEMKKKLFSLHMDTFGAARERYEKISSQTAEEILREGGVRARYAIADLITTVRDHMSVSV